MGAKKKSLQKNKNRINLIIDSTLHRRAKLLAFEQRLEK